METRSQLLIKMIADSFIHVDNVQKIKIIHELPDECLELFLDVVLVDDEVKQANNEHYSPAPPRHTWYRHQDSKVAQVLFEKAKKAEKILNKHAIGWISKLNSSDTLFIINQLQPAEFEALLCAPHTNSEYPLIFFWILQRAEIHVIRAILEKLQSSPRMLDRILQKHPQVIAKLMDTDSANKVFGGSDQWSYDRYQRLRHNPLRIIEWAVVTDHHTCSQSNQRYDHWHPYQHLEHIFSLLNDATLKLFAPHLEIILNIHHTAIVKQKDKYQLSGSILQRIVNVCGAENFFCSRLEVLVSVLGSVSAEIVAQWIKACSPFAIQRVSQNYPEISSLFNAQNKVLWEQRCALLSAPHTCRTEDICNFINTYYDADHCSEEELFIWIKYLETVVCTHQQDMFYQRLGGLYEKLYRCLQDEDSRSICLQKILQHYAKIQDINALSQSEANHVRETLKKLEKPLSEMGISIFVGQVRDANSILKKIAVTKSQAAEYQSKSEHLKDIGWLAFSDYFLKNFMASFSESVAFHYDSLSQKYKLYHRNDRAKNNEFLLGFCKQKWSFETALPNSNEQFQALAYMLSILDQEIQKEPSTQSFFSSLFSTPPLTPLQQMKNYLLQVQRYFLNPQPLREVRITSP